MLVCVCMGENILVADKVSLSYQGWVYIGDSPDSAFLVAGMSVLCQQPSFERIIYYRKCLHVKRRKGLERWHSSSKSVPLLQRTTHVVANYFQGLCSLFSFPQVPGKHVIHIYNAGRALMHLKNNFF